MAKTKRTWHPNFIKYMEEIIHHPNYKGLPIQKNKGHWIWIAPKNSPVGKQRLAWCQNKAMELNLPIQPGVYAKVMREIHPTKEKVCQTCGKSMSIYYFYPSTHLVKAIDKVFHKTYSETTHISKIWDDLLTFTPEQTIIDFFVNYAKLDLGNKPVSKENIIENMEFLCREKGGKCLGPGAMSNFPDRFDGFHTYNRCCRAKQDKGRSKDNLKSYTKDRRAFEYWSDGNIHAANCFMGSSRFAGTSADHIGPISLGFIHDPRYIHPMKSNENSSKRDRLLLKDIFTILDIEKKTKIFPMSWFSKEIWNNIKCHKDELTQNNIEQYQRILKQNRTNFMFILWQILERNKKLSVSFLVNTFLAPKMEYFNYSYIFDRDGNITQKKVRHKTERSADEFKRLVRIAIKAVYDFQQKENRNLKNDLNNSELQAVGQLCQAISDKSLSAKTKFEQLMCNIQHRLLKNI